MGSQARIGGRCGGTTGHEGGLRFYGSASHTSNIEGRLSYKKVVWYDDFTGKTIDTTNDYTINTTNVGTATITVPHCLTLTTNNVDTDEVELFMGLEWYPHYNACMEARFRIDDVANCAVNIGFADAQAYAADTIAFTANGATPSLVSTAANGIVLLLDGDCTNSNIFGVSVNGGSDGSIINSLATPTNGDWFTGRIELVDNGTTVDAIFYLNADGKAIDPYNDVIGVELDAVARTTALTPIMAIICENENSANTLDVDYLKVWQDRQ